jgi:hypothetical protein
VPGRSPAFPLAPAHRTHPPQGSHATPVHARTHHQLRSSQGAETQRRQQPQAQWRWRRGHGPCLQPLTAWKRSRSEEQPRRSPPTATPGRASALPSTSVAASCTRSAECSTCVHTNGQRAPRQLPAPRSCRRGRSGDGTHHQHLLLCWDVAHQLRQSGLGVLTQLRTGALPAQPLDAAATAAAAAAAAAAAPG